MAILSFGDHLKEWRARRRVSQLTLALEANVSSRHISFLESGRASPSRQMVQQLAQSLDVPLRGRNALLQAAGFAAAYPETPLDDAALEPVRAAIGWMLDKHMPYPAMVFDRYWNLRGSNPVAAALFGLPETDEPVNILQAIVGNPAATARFENWPEIVRHMTARLKLEVEASGGDPKLVALYELLAADPAHDEEGDEPPGRALVCSRIRISDNQTLSLFSTIAQFGTSEDITVNDLRLELFFPGDPGSEDVLKQIAADLTSNRQ